MDYIKQKRIALGKSAKEVYEHLGIDRVTYWRYENGVDIKNIPYPRLIELSEFLKFDINEYLQKTYNREA